MLVAGFGLVPYKLYRPTFISSALYNEVAFELNNVTFQYFFSFFYVTSNGDIVQNFLMIHDKDLYR